MRQLPHENVSKRRKSIAQVSLACLTDFNCIRLGKANYADEGPQRLKTRKTEEGSSPPKQRADGFCLVSPANLWLHVG
jgi:hypothetical protein